MGDVFDRSMTTKTEGLKTKHDTKLFSDPK